MHEWIELDKGIFIISIDTEFAWGFIDMLNTNLARKYLNIIKKRSRTNILKILKISEELNIPITFGFVGRLLLDDDQSRNSVWYARDVFQQVLSSRVEHEIACHSFSHIDFSRCSREEAQQDIRMCKRVMKNFGVDPVSFLYPRNRIGYLDILEKEGFKTFRYKIRYKYTRISLLNLFKQQYSLPLKIGKLLAVPANYLFQSSSYMISTAIWFTTLKALKEIAVKRRVFHIMLHDYIESDIIILYLKYLLTYAKKLENQGLIEIRTLKDIYDQYY
ncbi:MAG: polysaccharide deacetylase family protein [Thermofilum sp.]|nr:polysaccharide deacetylase family protein [Thermofilum sp.]